MHAQIASTDNGSLAHSGIDALVGLFDACCGTGASHVQGVGRTLTVNPVRDAVSVHGFVAAEEEK